MFIRMTMRCEGGNTMNESTVSSAFQALFRQTVPEAVVIKHSDKSMIGMPDASITYNKKTLWLEYKFIGPKTKGVTAQFMCDGWWSGYDVAAVSPTQFDMVKRLVMAGNALYVFWVLDFQAKRKKIAYIQTFNPITCEWRTFNSNHDLVTHVLTNILTP